VYANDVTVLTTRVYPWLSASKNAGFFVRSSSSFNGIANGSVRYSGVEVWDGLVNAWPKRPNDTRKKLLWDGPMPGIWAIWTGF